jgi:hypothetical protein
MTHQEAGRLGGRPRRETIEQRLAEQEREKQEYLRRGNTGPGDIRYQIKLLKLRYANLNWGTGFITPSPKGGE